MWRHSEATAIVGTILSTRCTHPSVLAMREAVLAMREAASLAGIATIGDFE